MARAVAASHLLNTCSTRAGVTQRAQQSALIAGFVVGLAGARQVVQEDHRVGLVDLGPAARDADALDLVGRVRSASRSPAVSTTCTGTPSIWIVWRDLVARGAGNRRHDGQFGAGQRVEQRALADVGLAGQHHRHAFGQAARPGACGRAPARDRRAIASSRPRASALLEKVDLLFGKVERGLDQRAQLDEALRQRVDVARERAGQRARRRARGRFGVGVDQVGDRLGLRQVELAVEERAQRELAGLRQSQARRAARRLASISRRLQAARKQQLQHHRAAMGLQLEHVFAGVRVRRRKEQRQAVVDGAPWLVEQRTVVRDARRQRAAR